MVQIEVNRDWLLEGFRYELETTTRPKTVAYYCGHIRRFQQWAQAQGVSDIHVVSKRDIQAFFHSLLQESAIAVGGNGSSRRLRRTERTRWPYYISLRRFFAWAVKEGYLEQNPLQGIELKRPKDPPIEPYRLEHIQQILNVLDHDWKVAATTRQKMLAARDRAVFLFFLESGLRCGEMWTLQQGDIDLPGQRATVRVGKTGKGRVVGFGPETKKALWRYLSLRPPEISRGLWLTEEYRPMSLEGIRQIVRRLKKDAGLEHLKGSVHKLRHTFATTYLRHTKDMKGCRILLGHSTLAMTERYTQFIEAEDALKAYDGQGPLDWLRG